MPHAYKRMISLSLWSRFPLHYLKSWLQFSFYVFLTIELRISFVCKLAAFRFLLRSLAKSHTSYGSVAKLLSRVTLLKCQTREISCHVYVLGVSTLPLPTIVVLGFGTALYSPLILLLSPFDVLLSPFTDSLMSDVWLLVTSCHPLIILAVMKV